MRTAQQLREARANTWAQMQELDQRSEGRELDAQEREQWDRLEAELTAHTEELGRRERHDERSEVETPEDVVTRGTGPTAGGDDPEAEVREVFGQFIRGGLNALEPEQRQAMVRRHVEARALGVGTPSAGGYTVPQVWRNEIIETLNTISSVRGVVQVISTESGAQLNWPTADDTANVGAILAENAQVTEQDAAFGTALLEAYTYTSKLVRVSMQLLQDNAFAVEAWLRGALARRLARILNQHYTTGTGTAQPDGVAVSPTVGKTGATGQTTTVVSDDLIDLVYSVDPIYRTNGRFMLRDASIASVRKLKGSDGQYMWQPSLQAGEPDSLLSYPIVSNNDMPAMAANAFPILFGDFNEYYVVRDVQDIQVLRLEERYADFLQIGFLAFLRSDGTKQNVSAVKAYRNSAT